MHAPQQFWDPKLQNGPTIVPPGQQSSPPLGPDSSASADRQGPHLPFRRLHWQTPWMPVLFVGSWHRMRLLWPFFLAWMAGQMLVAASHPPLLPCHTHRSSSLQAFFFIGVHSTSRSGTGCSLPGQQGEEEWQPYTLVGAGTAGRRVEGGRLCSKRPAQTSPLRTFPGTSWPRIICIC